MTAAAKLDLIEVCRVLGACCDGLRWLEEMRQRHPHSTFAERWKQAVSARIEYACWIARAAGVRSDGGVFDAYEGCTCGCLDQRGKLRAVDTADLQRRIVGAYRAKLEASR